MTRHLEFQPWSDMVLAELGAEYSMGRYTVLDLELSAACALRAAGRGCIYCDSPAGDVDSQTLDWEATTSLIEQAGQLHYRWLFICGLGEPLDDPRLHDLVDLASIQGLRITLFTNGLGLTKEATEHFERAGVCLICKLDSLKPEQFSRILTKDVEHRSADAMLQNVTRIIKSGYCADFCEKNGESRNHTCLAASIVPTRFNHAEIPAIVEYCISHHVFPLIGQLEKSGKAKDIFQTIALTTKELIDLKAQVEAVLGFEYAIPVCPAALFGIHVDHIGTIVVDRATGLSCPWFSLREPVLHKIGTVQGMRLGEAEEMVTNYRAKRQRDVRAIMDTFDGHVFGGCGGRNLLQTYLALLESFKVKETS